MEQITQLGKQSSSLVAICKRQYNSIPQPIVRLFSRLLLHSVPFVLCWAGLGEEFFSFLARGFELMRQRVAQFGDPNFHP